MSDGQEKSPTPGRVSVLEDKVRQLEQSSKSPSASTLRQQDFMQDSNLSKIMRDMEESGWLPDKRLPKDVISPVTPQTIPSWRMSPPGSSGTTLMSDLGLGNTLSSIQAKAEALAATRAAALMPASSTTQPVRAYASEITPSRYPGFGTTPPVVVSNDIEVVEIAVNGSPPAENAGATTPAPLSPGLSNRGIRTPLRGEAGSSSLRFENSSTASPNSTSLLSLIRRELDHVETRLKAQISQVKEGLSSNIQKTDKLREVAISRLDQKVGQCEVAQSKLDRKVSELSGTLRGLSDEAQAQIRRADTVDSRLWEFRHTLEEDFRQKLADVGLQLQEMSSNCRIALSASEDVQKRLSSQIKRMEAQIQDIGDLNHSQSLMDFKARLESIELGYTREAENTKAVVEEIAAVANKKPDGPNEATDARLWQLEQQSADVMQKLERLFMEAHGDRGWDARFQEHEVRLQGIRSKLDSQEAHFTGADDRFRQECEQRFDHLRKGIKDMNTKQLNSQERVEDLARSTEVAENAITQIISRLQVVCADVAKQNDQLQAIGQTISPQVTQIENLNEHIQSLAIQARGKDEELATLRKRVREMDNASSSKDQKDRDTSMDILRRMMKLENEVSCIANAPQIDQQVAPLRPPPDPPKELPKERIMAASADVEELRKQVILILDSLREQDKVARDALQSSRTSSQAIDDIHLRLDRVEARSTHQATGSHVVNTVSQDGVTEMRSQIQDLMLRMPSAERLSKHFAELKTLAEKLTDVQRDTARQLVYAEANSPGGSSKQPEDGREGLAAAPPVKELLGRMAQQEVAVEFIRKQIAEMWDTLVAIRGRVTPRDMTPRGTPIVDLKADGLDPNCVVVEREVPDVAADVVTQELGSLFQRVEEGEMECAKLQDQLKGRIATMDQLLDKVAREVLGPEGADVAAAVAMAVGAVEQISQSLPKGLRLCILGSFSGETPFNRLSSKRLVEAIARKVSERLAGDIVVLTCGMPGVQECFVRSLSSNVKVINLVAEDGSYNYGVGENIAAGTTLEDRMVLLGQLGHVYITVEGSPTVAKEAKAAFARGAAVLPLICTGDASAGTHDFPVAALRKPPFATDDQWSKLLLENEPELTAGAVVDMIEASLMHIGCDNGFN